MSHRPPPRPRRTPEELQDLVALTATPGLFASYVSGGRWVMAPHLAYLDKIITDGIAGRGSKRLIVSMPPRHGKALAVDTPIPIPGGWTTIGELSPGDDVFDEAGQICRVVGKTPVWKDRPVYRVTTDCGDEIIADAEHEWVVRLDRKFGAISTRTTKFLAERTCDRAPMIAAQGSLDLPYVDLPMDPYILGVWLGDGTATNGSITTADPEIVEAIRATEGEVAEWKSVSRGRAASYRPGPSLRSPNVRAGDTFQGRLRAMGLLGNKHIPAEYMRASADQRLSLLQGLIDTDGHVAPDGQVEFCNVNELLAKQVRELVYSLGHKASMIAGRSMLNGVDHGPKYRVMFYMKDAARLPRKAARTRDGLRAFRRYITVEPAGIADTVCIQVDSPNHMFLCGRSMLPTHNSWYLSRYLPAWFLGTYPDRSVMLAGYGAKFAKVWGARALAELSSNADLFDLIVPPKQSAEHWTIPGREGSMWTSGVGGSMTGRGADLLIIDDPIKNQEEADSEAYRESTWQWWMTTARSRLEPNGMILIVLTRWHEDDLAGRILSGKYVSQDDAAWADKWDVVSLPALAEANDPLSRRPGDPLWPQRYSERALRAIKGGITPRAWAALYQQNPQPLEGGLFARDDWRTVYALPDLEYVHNWVRYWDKAGTPGAGDFSAGVLMCEWQGTFFVVDVVRGQWSASQREAVIRSTAHRDRTMYGQAVETWVEQEPGSGGKESAESSVKNLAGFIVYAERVTGEKAVRAGPLASQVQMHNVAILNAPWNEAFLLEMQGFPNWKNDDQVDGASGAFNKLCAKTFPALQTEAIVAERREVERPDESGGRFGVSSRSAGSPRFGIGGGSGARVFRRQ